MRKKTLLLVDGHNVFIRAYSGLKNQDLKTSKGLETYGVYGSLVTIANMIRRYEPTHVLVAFDHGRSSKRLAIDSKYKANRVKSKEDRKEELATSFRPQLELFFELCHKIGIPYLRLNNVEADDIIAKAAISFGPSFEQVVIISADHDIHQLIRDNTIVIKPSFGQSKGNREKIHDVESVKLEWGLEPQRLPEIWALTGDRGDNVDGIPGIGPKKARKLIEEHGSLWKVLASEDPKVVDHIEVVQKAFKLIELNGLDDIPFPPLGNLQFNPVSPGEGEHQNELKELMAELELNSIRDRWLQGTLWRDLKIGRKLNAK